MHALPRYKCRHSTRQSVIYLLARFLEAANVSEAIAYKQLAFTLEHAWHLQRLFNRA